MVYANPINLDASTNLIAHLVGDGISLDTSDRHIGVRDHFAVLNIETSNIYQISIIAVASERTVGNRRKKKTRVLEMKLRENSQSFMNHNGIEYRFYS